MSNQAIDHLVYRFEQGRVILYHYFPDGYAKYNIGRYRSVRARRATL